ncbi:AAA family ATPase [Streptomyces sp. NPDC047070]|uniref:AAA family ATPase n=1 Tax=Streptomyces sp. NPDC047070 TaxID=3154923 RepID=UPI0034514D47
MDDVLRRPTPPPGVPEPFVGREAEAEALAERLRGWTRPGSGPEHPKTVVFHGPAGVGKSALAAAVVKRLDQGRRVSWLSLSEASSAETTLLRLLAEHAAPRRPIVEAALEADRTGDQKAFAHEVRVQCLQHVRNCVLVLDGAWPALGRELLPALVEGTNLVIVTSRHKAKWAGLGAYLHEVRRLGVRDAVRLAEEVSATHTSGHSPGAGHSRFVAAARGLPLWLRVAGSLMARPDRLPPLPVDGPGDLLSITMTSFDPAVADMLLRLASRETATASFAAHTVEWLLPEDGDPGDVPHVLASLGSYELLLGVGEGRLMLPSPIAAAALLRMPQIDRELLASRVNADVENAATTAALRAARLLDGRSKADGSEPEDSLDPRLSPDDIAQHMDEFMSLLPQGTPLREPQVRLADALATLLAVRGDAHRLVTVLRTSGKAARGALGRALRDLGVKQSAPDGAAPEQADHWYRAGQLRHTLVTADSAPEAHGVDFAWLSTFRGAALCDQGKPLEAEAVLTSAWEEHRRAGCVRGGGWALLHHARACLLMGRVYHASQLLGQGAASLRRAGDIRGRNWVATEQIRLRLLQGDTGEALDIAQRALTAHEEAEDIRGMGWTCHYLGMSHARRGRPADAHVALLAAARHFRQCGDALGAAWTRHRLALLLPAARRRAELLLTAEGYRTIETELLTAAEEFRAIGCPRGQAWSLLEFSVRSSSGPDERDNLPTAESLFRTLDDQAGLAWSYTAGAARGLADMDSVERLTGPEVGLSADVNGRAQLKEDIAGFWRAAVVGDVPVIPLHARDTVGVPDRHKHKPLTNYIGPRSGRPSPSQCRVRLTLFDDSPSPQATVRLLLRVVPGPDHPWAALPDERPWLTAVAVPLTPASLEPATALLRPSSQETHGAEFTFTARRPGIHVIRFTVALERTGTVLQQVETELEILDTDHPVDHASPHATTVRGR